jgi:hypothetical protein
LWPLRSALFELVLEEREWDIGWNLIF